MQKALLRTGRNIILSGILLLSSNTLVLARVTSPAQISPQDRKFILNTSQDGMTEIKLGEIGKRNAYDQAVKDFADRMVEDHNKANQSLKEIAKEKGVIVQEQLDRKHNTLVSRLSKLHGSKFDQAYIEQILKDHKETISILEVEKQKGESDLRNWAKETLPVMEEHLRVAQDINTKIQNR